ncbi:hypothetical protein [Candidatus Cyanaurora vandensis]|uniref:hypothetical protein n=1 Tax=Candidatus Cyanaurora vandensis TaxID=2714958 RepID=UPI00257C5F68|nr:hypothetical protein [Candidatus Cyanaurora vandensis]
MLKLNSALVLALVSVAASAAPLVPNGLYLELYYGAKSGGPSNHNSLYRKLSKDQELLGFALFCVKGFNRSADSGIPGYAVDRERRLPPVVARQGKGSGAILMGPVQGENIEELEDHLGKTYLHLYSKLRKVE